MATSRTKRRWNELRELVNGQVDVRNLGNLYPHEVREQASLHREVAHNHQASWLSSRTTQREVVKKEMKWTGGTGAWDGIWIARGRVFSMTVNPRSLL